VFTCLQVIVVVANNFCFLFLSQSNVYRIERVGGEESESCAIFTRCCIRSAGILNRVVYTIQIGGITHIDALISEQWLSQTTNGITIKIMRFWEMVTPASFRIFRFVEAESEWGRLTPLQWSYLSPICLSNHFLSTISFLWRKAFWEGLRYNVIALSVWKYWTCG